MDQMPPDDPQKLLDEMRRVREEVRNEAAELMERWEPMLQREEFRASAENFAHYLACAGSTCVRCRRHWCRGGWPRSDAAKHG